MEGPLAARFIRNIDANRTIKDALTAAVGANRPRWRISVTDLVNPAQAYYRWKRPEIRPSLDRLQVMMAGTGFHDIFGKIISTEEFLEQTLEAGVLQTLAQTRRLGTVSLGQVTLEARDRRVVTETHMLSLIHI